jgi:hypothetical protein
VFSEKKHAGIERNINVYDLRGMREIRAKCHVIKATRNPPKQLTPDISSDTTLLLISENDLTYDPSQPFF